MVRDGEPPADGVVMVVVPFPAQGHLNQLLHFCRLISLRHDFPVHYVSSGTHIRQAKDRVHGWDLNAFPNVRFHSLPIPPFATPPPDPHAAINFPSHLQPAFDASLHLRAPFASLLGSLCETARRVVVVHDSLMSFAAGEAAAHRNAEAYAFHPISAFAALCYLRGYQKDGLLELSSLLPGVTLQSYDGCFTDEFRDFVVRQHLELDSDSSRILNVCRPMEGKFLDLLAQEPVYKNTKLFAFGPFHPVALDGAGSRQPRHDCLKWLDQQPPRSVIYVSFGSSTSLTSEQVDELSIGLERSRQRFMWVLRAADRGDIFAAAADGEDDIKREQQKWSDYDRRVEGRGIVVREWAPQLEILAHPSTGGFISHCGWNSSMESMSMGVPMLAWPMHSDQPRNAQMVTEILRVGVMVKDWARRHELVPSAAIVDSIKRVLASGDEGKEIRRRAEELGDAVRQSVAEGGSSFAELDSFIAHVTR